MSSPVTGDDFTVATPGQSFCERMTNLLSLSAKMKLFFDWAFDSTGAPTQAFRFMSLPPPGVMQPYYTLASYEAAIQQILRLDRTEDDIAANGTDPSQAVWVMCNGDNGTPDLRGRTIIGAGQGSGLTLREVGGTLGAESFTLNADSMPQHGHALEGRLAFAAGKNSDGEDDFGAVYNLDGSGDSVPVTQYSDISTENNYLYAKPNPDAPTETVLSLMQPSFALYWIMRTSRTA